MTTVTVATLGLPEVVNVIPGRGVELDAAESFLALLNAGAPKPEKERGSEPPAAPIDVPLPELIPPPRREAGGVHGEPETRTLAEDILPPVEQAAPPAKENASRRAESNEHAPAKASPHTESPPDEPAVNGSDHSAATADAGDATDVAQGIRRLRARLQQQLAHLNQLLQSIIQALSGQAVADAALPEDVHAALQALHAGQAIPEGAETTELALLKDIQSILQQLQALQAFGAPVPKTPTDILIAVPAQDLMKADYQLPPQLIDPAQAQALLDALDAGIAKLSQLLAKSPAADSLATNPSFAPLGALIKQAIADLRAELQQLQEENQALILRLQESLQIRLPQGSPVLQDLLARQGLVLQEKVVPPAGSPLAADKPVNLQPAAMTVPQDAAPSGVNAQPQQTAAANAVPMAGGQPDVGGQTGGNSQGQNQPLPAPATPASAGAAQSAGNAGSLSFARVIDQAVQRPLVEQVSFHIKTAIADGSSKITIRLEPAELGRLDIRLTIGSDGKTGVIITADNKQTLTLLQQESQGLARALNDAGLSTDSGNLSFNLRGGEQEWTGAEGAQASLTYRNQQPEEEDDALNVLTRSYVVNLAEGLDIKI